MSPSDNKSFVDIALKSVGSTRWGFTDIERDCRNLAVEIRRQLQELSEKSEAAAEFVNKMEGFRD